jgi:hypothetical protein
MKQIALLATVLAALAVLPALAQPTQSAGQDMNNAGTQAKGAAKSTGSATKKTAKKAKAKTKQGTNKAAQKTEQGAQKVQDKTAQ